MNLGSKTQAAVAEYERIGALYEDVRVNYDQHLNEQGVAGKHLEECRQKVVENPTEENARAYSAATNAVIQFYTRGETLAQNVRRALAERSQARGAFQNAFIEEHVPSLHASKLKEEQRRLQWQKKNADLDAELDHCVNEDNGAAIG